jgi:hypothetical protein
MVFGSELLSSFFGTLRLFVLSNRDFCVVVSFDLVQCYSFSFRVVIDKRLSLAPNTRSL